jgi:hypothetical protein
VRQIVKIVLRKVDQRSFAEAMKEGFMNRLQGKQIEGVRKEEGRSATEYRDNLHREGDFWWAPRQEGDNFNQPSKGGGRNQRYYGNQ